jgi:hypothetical protein
MSIMGFLYVCDSLGLPWALNTIASKPEHDKVTCRMRQGLNRGVRIAIVLPDGSPRTEISP